MTQRALRCRTTAERRIADDTARADDADIAGINRVQQTRPTGNPLALPAHLRHRIISKISRAAADGIFLQTQNGIGPQRKRSSEVGARRHLHLTSAQHPAAVQRLLEYSGVVGRAITHRPEIPYIEQHGGACRCP
jgi:hypothetical protein